MMRSEREACADARRVDVVMANARKDDVERKLTQESVLVRFGHEALAATDLEALLDRAVRVAAQTLDVPLCAVFDRVPGGSALVLRAGVGWADGSVGSAVVGPGAESRPGYTLLGDRPVIVASQPQETRFAAAPLFVEHGVVSGLCVLIRGATANRAFCRIAGVADVESLRRRTIVDFYEDASERERLRGMLDREGVVNGFEADMRAADGRRLRVSIVARLVRSSSGAPLRSRGHRHRRHGDLPLHARRSPRVPREAGCDAYLAKPFKPAELLALVDDARSPAAAPG